MEIWINPACSKCRAATTALDEAGIDYVVRRYLDDPPTVDELVEVLDRLGLEPWDITRHGEPAARAQGLDRLPKDGAYRSQWVEALAAYPILIQRPIITADDGTTVVGRSSDQLARVFDA